MEVLAGGGAGAITELVKVVLAGSGSGVIANLGQSNPVSELYAGSGSGLIANLGPSLSMTEFYAGSGSGVIADLGASSLMSEFYAGSGSGVIADLGASTPMSELYAGSGSGIFANLGTSVAMTSRTTKTYTTSSLDQFGVADFAINIGFLAELVAIRVSEPSWVRIYRTSSQRAADSRTSPGGNLQAIIDLGENKPTSENVTTQADQMIVQNPVPLMQGDDNGLIYVRLIKQNSGAAPVTLTITIFLEEI
jgi:hypothetical protein